MKILSYGSLNIDHVYSVDNIVKPGETVAINSYFKNPGGKGLNLSAAISKAGSYVYHGGLVGKDGQFLLDTLKENKVDCTYVNKVEGVSGQAIIQVSKDGENSILVNGGTNLKQDKGRIEEVLSHFQPNDIIVLQNEVNLLNFIIGKAYEKGLTIALNPSPFNAEIGGIDLSKITYIVLNEIEGRELTQKKTPLDIANELLKKFPNIKVVLTLGSKGVLYLDSKQEIKIDAYKTTVVDTTAAGDTFFGFFISSISKGESTKDALEVATKAASITVSRKGASGSIPQLDEVNNM